MMNNNIQQLLRQGIQEQQQQQLQQQQSLHHQPNRKGKPELSYHSSIDIYRNKQQQNSTINLQNPDSFDKKHLLQHKTSSLGKAKSMHQQLLNSQSNLTLSLPQQQQQQQSAPFPVSAQSRSQKRQNLPTPNQEQPIQKQSHNNFLKLKRFQDSSFSDGEADSNTMFFSHEPQSFREKQSFTDRADILQHKKYYQQKQQQYFRGLSSQNGLMYLVDKQLSQKISSPTSNQLSLRNSSLGKQRQKQQRSNSPKEQVLQQSQDVTNHPHFFNLSLPRSNSNIQKNNNSIHNTTQLKKQDKIMNNINNYTNLNACNSPTIHDAEPGIQTEKWNSFNGTDLYASNQGDNSQLSQLDALQLENNLLIRGLLSTINQQQQQQQIQQNQPYFINPNHQLKQNNNDTGNVSFYEKTNNPLIACSVPNSPHSYSVQQQGMNKKFLASSVHNNNNNNSNEEKFIDFQNQLNELSRQLNISNKNNKKAGSTSSRQSQYINEKKEQNCQQFSNISISKLAQQQPYQNLHSQRAYLLEQSIQRKVQQKQQQPQKGGTSPSKIDILQQKRQKDKFFDEDKTFESEFSKSKQQQISQEISTLIPSESSKKIHSPASKSPLERSECSSYKYKEFDDPSICQHQQQSQSQQVFSLERQLKTIFEEKNDIQQSLRSSLEENDKISFENRKLKQEITKLEGIISSKESFELEREKQTGIIKTQQQIMISNYEAIKLQSADVLAKYQIVSSELNNLEKQNQNLQVLLKEKDAQMDSLLRETKLSGQYIERSNESAIMQAAFPFINKNNNTIQSNNNVEDDQQQIIKLKNQITKLTEELKSKDQEIHRQAEALNEKVLEIKQKEDKLRSANELEEKLTEQVKQLELIKGSGGVEQQKMKQQIHISEATIHLLNQEIESYKTELIQVRQLCSISVVPQQRQTVSKQQYRLLGSVQPGEIEGLEQLQATTQNIQLQEQYQKLQQSYQELKAKEVQYEKSINDLKVVFEEENKARKNLETEITQLKTPFNFQKNMSVTVGSASKVVQDLILKQKKENALDASTGKNTSTDEEISLYKDIIQGLTTQLSELQVLFEKEKKEMKEEIKTLNSEKEQKSNEIQKLIMEINKLKKELEFSEIKETLNDREEEMTQLRNKNEELIVSYKAVQEKRNSDRNQILKENKEQIDNLKKDYEYQLNRLKNDQETAVNGQDSQSKQTADQNQSLKITKIEDELSTCRNIYARILSEELISAKLLVSALNSSNLIDQDESQKIIGENELADVNAIVESCYQTGVNNTGNNSSSSNNIKNINNFGCFLSTTMQNSLKFKQNKKEMLKSFIEKVKEKTTKANERVQSLERENRIIKEECLNMSNLVTDLEAKNKLAESIAQTAQQNHMLLQGKIQEHLQSELKQNSQQKIIMKSQLSSDNTDNNNNNNSNSNNVRLFDSMISAITSNNNLQDSIQISNNVLGTSSIGEAHSHSGVFQDDKVLTKINLETVIESGESGLRPDTTPSQENLPVPTCKISFSKSASYCDQRFPDLQRQLEEMNNKLMKVQQELSERIKQEEVLTSMLKAEASRKKIVEGNLKKLREEFEKSEKARKAQLETNKKLQQKIAQNESFKEFFEQQLKEQKIEIEQLQEERRQLKNNGNQMSNNIKSKISCSSSNNNNNNTFLAQSSSQYNPMSSSAENESVMDAGKLLSELQDKINENGELQQAKERLESELEESKKSLMDLSEQVGNLEMEIEVLTNQLEIKKEENQQLQVQILQLEHNNQNQISQQANTTCLNTLLKNNNFPEGIHSRIDEHDEMAAAKSHLVAEELMESSMMNDSQKQKEQDVLQDLKHMAKNFRS